MSRPFIPIATATLAATASSAVIALPATVAAGQRRTGRMINTGPSLAFVELGASTVTAVAGGNTTATPDGSWPLLPGVIEVFELQPGRTHLAAICQAGGTALIRITVGEGE